MPDTRPVNVLISREIGECWRRLPPEIALYFCEGDVASLDAALTPEIDVLVTDPMPSGAATQRWGGLRWVQLMSAGIDQAIEHPLRHEGVAIASAAGITAVHIAEFVLGRILYHTRRFAHFAGDQSAHRWGDRVALAGPSLRGMRAVIVGYGGVGRETARLLAACGMRIVAVMRDPGKRRYDGYQPYRGFGDPDATIPDRLVPTGDLSTVLPDADVVILSLPLTPETRHLIDARVLAAFNPRAILINTARGGVVKTEDLLVALDRGRPAHAYLDVFEEEPLPAASPIWDHPAVSVTPHMAGVMPDTAEKLEELFLFNLDRFRRGERLINQLP